MGEWKDVTVMPIVPLLRDVRRIPHRLNVRVFRSDKSDNND